MTITCGIIEVTAPPSNITATDMIISQTTCVEPCNSDVTITWKNNGGQGSFEPAIIVNGIRTGLGSSITLTKNQTYTETFTLTGLTNVSSPYTICPDPN